MPLNAQFFATLRTGLYSAGVTQSAVDGLNSLCATFDTFTGHDHCVDDLAAIMATAYLETGSDINLAIREVGRGAGKAYGKPAGPYNQIYYGRGPCQETWLANYLRSMKRTGIDFVQHPDLMLDPKYGNVNMLDGMYNGLFTGKGLRNFITPGVPTTLERFMAARAVINGHDKADYYGKLCVAFQRALTLGYDKPVTAPPVLSTAPQASTPLPAKPAYGLVAEIASWFRRKG